jgi:CarboxypepD_reg-like domain
MMKTIFSLFLILSFLVSEAQNNGLSGIVRDALTNEVLAGASITLFSSGHVLGGISNGEGKFSVSRPEQLDSVRVSMIGYLSKSFKMTGPFPDPVVNIRLERAVSALQEVVVHPLDAMDIVRRASQQIPSMIPPRGFESNSFYREIIRDSLRYYSVAEAVFNIIRGAKKII